MALLLLWLISAATIGITAYILPGVKVGSYWTALLVALVLGLVNLFIRPFLIFLTLPINILTLGLFTFVVNALMILLVAAIVPNFEVEGFWNALIFAVLLMFINYIFFLFIP